VLAPDIVEATLIAARRSTPTPTLVLPAAIPGPLKYWVKELKQLPSTFAMVHSKVIAALLTRFDPLFASVQPEEPLGIAVQPLIQHPVLQPQRGVFFDQPFHRHPERLERQADHDLVLQKRVTEL
jgi:hypothetical protein